MSQEDADKVARVAMIKQLEVKVTGKDVSFQQETTGGAFSYSVSSEVVEQVNIDISGLDIVKRHADACRSRYYARAKLDRDKAVHAWQIDLRNVSGQRQELMRQVAEAQTRRHMMATLAGWARMFALDNTAAQLERRIEYLAPEQRPAESSARRMEQDRQEFNARVEALQVRKAGGDEQTAKPGKPLAQPLSARVVAALPEGETPVPDVAVQFAFESGQGEMDPVAHTDAQGRAQATVRSVAPGTGQANVTARIVMEHLGLDLPPAFAQDVERRLGVQVARFSITPPPAFTEGSVLSKHLHELALTLASRVNQSTGVLAVMQDFVENRSQRRLSFSSRIEQGLSSGLIKTGILQVVEGQTGGKQTAKAVIFGVYESESNGNIWISAKLRRVTDNVSEADAETTIPRDALAEGDVRELTSVQAPPASAPILAAPGTNQPYRQWVEAFWDLRNPSGFTTELVAERPQYRVDEKAIFRFRTTQDCYVTVVNIGASGAWTVLLPNAYRSDPKQTLVRVSDGWVTIPSSADGFDFTVSRPLGTERVKAICTARPITLVQNMDLSQHVFQLTPQDGSKLRDLQVTQAMVRREDWSEAHAEFRSLDVGQTETSGMRGLRLRGIEVNGGR